MCNFRCPRRSASSCPPAPASSGGWWLKLVTKVIRRFPKISQSRRRPSPWLWSSRGDYPWWRLTIWLLQRRHATGGRRRQPAQPPALGDPRPPQHPRLRLGPLQRQGQVITYGHYIGAINYYQLIIIIKNICSRSYMTCPQSVHLRLHGPPFVPDH